MAQSYIINGECLVQVKGMVGTPIESTQKLGLAKEKIVITPRFFHDWMKVDDFGPNVGPDKMWMLAEVHIRMTLIYFDDSILKICIRESMAGGETEGTFVGCGTPMGAGVALYNENNHYISLGLTSPVLKEPWLFPATLLWETPVEYPVGTSASEVVCHWLAVPYVPLPSTGLELLSAGAVLWQHANL